MTDGKYITDYTLIIVNFVRDMQAVHSYNAYTNSHRPIATKWMMNTTLPEHEISSTKSSQK